jgi:hypothetical protein
MELRDKDWCDLLPLANKIKDNVEMVCDEHETY